MEELAWAAGVFDGSGTITRIGNRNRLAVKKADEELVRRFGGSVGIGSIYGPYGPYKSQIGSLPTFLWLVDGNAALEVATLLWPWLGVRCRSRLEEVFGSGNFTSFC